MKASTKKASYSQFGEDIEIHDFFGQEFSGTFIDVGANDGVSGSNTYLLELRGWRGLLVEPIERLSIACRSSRPSSIVVNKAALRPGENEEIEFFEYSGIHTTGESFDGVSSVGSPSQYQDQILSAGGHVKQIKVPGTTLDRIIREAGLLDRIDFVSIDVEGLELDVLQGFSIQKYTPRLFLIEDNSFGADRRVTEYLAKFGYFRVHRTVVNDWYVTESDRRSFRVRQLVLKARLAFWWMIRLIRRVIPIRDPKNQRV